MKVFTEGKLTDSQVGTGDILSLDLYETDVQKLLKEGYAMDRFMGMGSMIIQGWALEDKVHMFLKEPLIEPEQLVSLDVDSGGDITYTFWHGVPYPEQSTRVLVYGLDDVLRSDPKNLLHKLGIMQARIYGAHMLSGAIQNSNPWQEQSNDSL